MTTVMVRRPIPSPCQGGAATPHGASPAEADRPLHREGPVSSVCKRDWLQECRSRTFRSDEEDRMDRMILWIIALGTLRWLASPPSWRTAAAVRLQPGLSRSRVR